MRDCSSRPGVFIGNYIIIIEVLPLQFVCEMQIFSPSLLRNEVMKFYQKLDLPKYRNPYPLVWLLLANVLDFPCPLFRLFVSNIWQILATLSPDACLVWPVCVRFVDLCCGEDEEPDCYGADDGRASAQRLVCVRAYLRWGRGTGLLRGGRRPSQCTALGVCPGLPQVSEWVYCVEDEEPDCYGADDSQASAQRLVCVRAYLRWVRICKPIRCENKSVL